MAKRRKTARKATRRKKTVRRKKSSRRGKKSGLTSTTYALSPELQEVVGSGKKTRPQVVKKLWAYIKSRGCQDKKNRRMINPDKKLSKIIGNRPVDMLKLATHLNKHIRK